MRANLDAAFRAVYGRDPEGVWVAPGRINLIGEHTDYNEGFVLPLALELGVAVAIARRHDRVLRLASRQASEIVEIAPDELEPGQVSGWAAYVAGVAWALRDAGLALGGCDVLCDGDVPAGVGLSSSAAIECATALALSDGHGERLDRQQLALIARRAENIFVGVPSGIMDQFASLLCRAGHALFLDTRSLEYDHVPLQLKAAELALLVVDTRTPRRLVAGAYAARRRSCEEAARTLGVRALRDVSLTALDQAMTRLQGAELRRRVRHVVTENARVLEAVALLRGGRIAEIGPLLDASHASLRDDYEVSCPELDVAVEAAVEAGALGARMTGAGFGGSAIVLVEARKVDAVGDAVASAFQRKRFAAPRHFVATAAAGARRLS